MGKSLRTNYTDAVFRGLRKYRKIDNSDGTVSFQDVTDYTAEGSFFGAEDINATNEAVNDSQKKNVIDNFVYTIAAKGRKIIIDEKNSYYIASEIRPGNKARLELNMKDTATGSDLSIAIEWYVTDKRCMLVSANGTSMDEYLPVACQKKEGYYCFDIIDFLLRIKKYIAIHDYTSIYSIEITEENTKVIIESGGVPSTALGNIMKRIGTTPLGFGDGTLTGAVAELLKDRNMLVPNARSLYDEIDNYSFGLAVEKGKNYMGTRHLLSTPFGRLDLLLSCVDTGVITPALYSVKGLGSSQEERVQLGTSVYPWKQLYASTSTIAVSDRNEKKDIADLGEDKIINFVMGLKPKSYKFIDNDSNRTHMGLIAQDIEELLEKLDMSTLDFAGFIKSPKEQEGEYSYGLRYEEFISPLIKVVQTQQKKINELIRENAELKERVGKNEAVLEKIKQKLDM